MHVYYSQFLYLLRLTYVRSNSHTLCVPCIIAFSPLKLYCCLVYTARLCQIGNLYYTLHPPPSVGYEEAIGVLYMHVPALCKCVCVYTHESIHICEPA